MGAPSDLPSGWTWTNLGSLGAWSGGGTPSKANNDFWKNGTIPWVSPKDMKFGRIRTAEDFITEEAVAQSATKFIPKNSILMVTRSGILAHSFPVAVTDCRVTVNQDLKTLTPFRGIEADYVAWYLRAQNSHLLKACAKHGTTVASIDTGRLKGFPVPLAPRKEERRIVDKIESLFSRLDKGEEAVYAVLGLLKRYRRSVLKAAVTGALTADWRAANVGRLEHGRDLLARILKTRRGTWSGRGRYKEPAVPNISDLPDLPEGWVWATVDQIASATDYGSSSKCSSDDSGVPVLRMGNIVDGELRLDSLKYLPQGHPEFPKLLLSDGDLLFNRTNSAELVGKTAVYRGYPDRCSFASYLIRVRLNGVLPELVSAFINSAYGRRWVKSVVSQQVGQANVNGAKLKALAVPVPPKKEQAELVTRLHRLFSQIATTETWCQTELARSVALRQSILKDAFAGRLVPQVTSDEPAEVLLKRIRATKKGK